ncbi:MAG: HEPN domain-containing protein [Spirochaetales bacterium]|nr:HEPN domain-containing protein [Spirochaetales bacterium]
MQPHEEWMFKAHQDLESAKLLFRAEGRLFDVAIYHTQQCAEKGIKAYLAFRDLKVGKTHSLRILLEQCQELEPAFEAIYNDCIYLEPFSIMYRYPEGDLMPSESELQKAVTVAEQVFLFVESRLQ